MEIKIFKQTFVSKLRNEVKLNLPKYRSEEFDLSEFDDSFYINTPFILDEESLKQLNSLDSNSENYKVECALLISNLLPGLTRYNARDERLWTCLTHTVLFDFTKQQWPVKEDNDLASKEVTTHFFAKGPRDIERNNPISSLWWAAKICENLEVINQRDALTALLVNSDFRGQIIERPFTAQNSVLLGALLKKMKTSLDSDKNFYKRSLYRSFFKELNLEGGNKLLTAFDVQSTELLIDSIFERV